MSCKNKRGFELSISTIVIIVLCMLVLIALVLGFTTGWEQFWSTVTNLFLGVSIKSAQQSCIMACQNDDAYDFCCLKRNARFSGEKEEVFCTDTRLGVQCSSINCDLAICIVPGEES